MMRSRPARSRPVLAWIASFAFLLGAYGSYSFYVARAVAGDWESAADESMRRAALALESGAPGRQRLETFHRELTVAEGQLLTGLTRQPSRASALAKLAVVRFELDPASQGLADPPGLALLECAAEIAPTSPRIQWYSGRFLARLGRTAASLPYLRRAVELDPRFATDAVALLDGRLPAYEILEGLPRTAEVLIAVLPSFRNDDLERDYVDEVERFAGSGREPLPVGLLGAYATSCVRTNQPARLAAVLRRWGPWSGAAEGYRLWQLARTEVRAGNLESAAALARRVAESDPRSGGLLERAADVLTATERPETARELYDQALAAYASTDAEPSIRAGVYRKIGQVNETLGNAARAYDAYRLALKLDPREAQAAARLRSMETEAGLGDAPEEP